MSYAFPTLGRVSLRMVIFASVFLGLVGLKATNSLAGPIAYWRLDGNLIDSIGQNDGTWTGTIPYVSAQFSKGLDFTGATNYVQTPLKLPATAKTMVILAKPNSFSTEAVWAGNGPTTSQRFYLGTRSFQNCANCAFVGGGGTVITDAAWPNSTAGVFYSFALVDSGSLTRTLWAYQNGNVVKAAGWTYSGSTATETGKYFLIGGGGGGNLVLANAVIDEVAVFDNMLTQSELSYIAQYGIDAYLRNTGQYTLAHGLMGYWDFDGGAQDRSGRGHHGQLKNGATLAPGKFGNALSLDGVDDYVEVPHAADLNPDYGNLTIAGWIKFQDKTTDQSLLSKGPNGHIYGLRVKGESGTVGIRGGLQNTVDTEPTLVDNTYYTAGTVNLEDNQWHHIAMVVDRYAGIQSYYIDGMLVGTTNLVASFSRSIHNTNPLYIGWGLEGAGNIWAKGLIDDVAVWNRALSASEIALLAQAPLGAAIPEPSTGILALLSMGFLSGWYTYKRAPKKQRRLSAQ